MRNILLSMSTLSLIQEHITSNIADIQPQRKLQTQSALVILLFVYSFYQGRCIIVSLKI
jgi:hypothetical protein